VDKPGKENQVRERMAELTGDSGWLIGSSTVKTLALEHHMSASRGGFLPMFEALDKDTRLSTGLRKGELAGIRFFTERVAPLLAAAKTGDKFTVMELLRQNSPLLEESVLVKTEYVDDPLWLARASCVC
jgi:DNA helicase-2/ATP-dependent DNA helicase PcrA